MSDYPAVAESPSGEPHPRLRAAALTAVVAGLVLVAGAAFVLSYQGIHQIALHAGVSPELARLYPVILDAMLVMSCAAALALRTAGLWTRCYVWGCLVLVLAAVAAGNALYAMNISLPAQPTRAVVAVLPWALLLMGFGMLLAMLRHWRRIRVASAEAGQAGPASPDEEVAAGATAGAVSWAGSPGNGPAKAGTPRSGKTAGAARANGSGGANQPAAATQPAEGTPAAGTQPAAPAGTAGPGPAPAPPPGPGARAQGTTGAAGPAGTAGPTGTARAHGPAGATPPGAAAGPARPAPSAAPPTAPLPAPTPVAGPAPAATPAGPAPAATPAGPAQAAAPATPVPATAPPAGTAAQAGTTVPFLDRILGGPTNPNAPEADDG